MRTLAILAAAATVLTAAPALAAGSEATAHQVTVRLADLDLATTSGAHAAVARLSRAAGEACGEQAGVSPSLVRLSDAFQRCRWAALETAVAKIHTTAVDVAFADAGGRTVQVAKR